jgi:hypothetical protein
VVRALRDGGHACWRFIEHHAEDPLLPPGVGWMQGAAGIAGYLFRPPASSSRAGTHRSPPGWTRGGPTAGPPETRLL